MEYNSKIYVAGHGGLVGSSVVRTLEKRRYSNLVLHTREELDLFNQKAVEDFFKAEKPEYVVLAAARAGGIKASMTYPTEFLFENLAIQNNVIWQAHLSGVKKLLFLSSSCVYPRECPQPMREEYLLTGPLEPTNEGYAIAKIAGMKLCEYIFDQYHQTFISCMPCNIYGEGDYFDTERGHVIGSLLLRIHKAKMDNDSEVLIWGTGKARREFLFADDLAEAVVFLLENYDKKEFLNVGTETDVTIRDLAELIQKIVGFEGKLAFDTTKPDGMPQKLLDVSRLNALGWKHSVSLEDGLRRSYYAYLKNEKNLV